MFFSIIVKIIKFLILNMFAAMIKILWILIFLKTIFILFWYFMQLIWLIDAVEIMIIWRFFHAVFSSILIFFNHVNYTNFLNFFECFSIDDLYSWFLICSCMFDRDYKNHKSYWWFNRIKIWKNFDWFKCFVIWWFYLKRFDEIDR